jgi:hypothetical protein
VIVALSQGHEQEAEAEHRPANEDQPLAVQHSKKIVANAKYFSFQHTYTQTHKHTNFIKKIVANAKYFSFQHTNNSY